MFAATLDRRRSSSLGVDIEAPCRRRRAGARIILDEVLLSGAAGQHRWNAALAGLSVFWIGVRCDRAIAAAREVARGDRIRGMAVSQVQRVHEGVVYDLEVDTSHTEALECARIIAANVLKSG